MPLVSPDCALAGCVGCLFSREAACVGCQCQGAPWGSSVRPASDTTLCVGDGRGGMTVEVETCIFTREARQHSRCRQAEGLQTPHTACSTRHASHFTILAALSNLNSVDEKQTRG